MKGFTLLEILIATTLTAVILTAVYGAYASNMETVQRARENGQLHQTARIVFDMMRKDLQCALGEDLLGLVGENEEVDGKPADRLQVITAASHAADVDMETGLYIVGYEMVKDEKGEGFTLFRTQEGIAGEGVGTGQQIYELTRMVTGLDLRFQDSEGRLLESWGSQEGRLAYKLPSLVRVRMVLKGSSGQEKVFTMAVHPELAGSPP
jgi:prepilin-type N-terminal cleavage/methylation domain-containing protein